MRHGSLIAAFAMLWFAAEAGAGIVLEDNRADIQALAGADFVDWSTLGVAGTQVSNPFDVLSNGGLNITVTKSTTGNFQRRDQGGAAPNGWNGDFANGDALLWTQDMASVQPTEITFVDFGGLALYAFGTQIAPNLRGDFTARVTAYDQFDNVVAAFTRSGVAGAAGDGSAIFIGATGDVPFYKVGISLDSAPSNTIGDFAINRIDFATLAHAPLPGSAWAGIAVLGAMGAVRRLRRRRTD